jgi:two-component system, NarL family, invasion response regulator UvrY
MAVRMISVLLVDDHVLVRKGFRQLLQDAPDLKVVAEADNGEQACALYQEFNPDVVVMDISMPGIGGIEAIRRILARHSTARVLALSAHEDTVHARRAMMAGACGYLSKRGAPEALVGAIRQVAEGKKTIDPAVAQQLALMQLSGTENPIDVLSDREFEIFIHLANGRPVAGIAEMLSLSPSTVGTHLYNIKQKLGAANAAELTMIAVRSGLIDP